MLYKPLVPGPKFCIVLPRWQFQKFLQIHKSVCRCTCPAINQNHRWSSQWHVSLSECNELILNNCWTCFEAIWSVLVWVQICCCRIAFVKNQSLGGRTIFPDRLAFRRSCFWHIGIRFGPDRHPVIPKLTKCQFPDWIQSYWQSRGVQSHQKRIVFRIQLPFPQGDWHGAPLTSVKMVDEFTLKCYMKQPREWGFLYYYFFILDIIHDLWIIQVEHIM